ncbi:MAG: hypothetical protein WD273_05750 [Trueperaceae bacterium]
MTREVRLLRLVFAVFATAIVLPFAALAQQDEGSFPFNPATHSHNDYYQPRPLLDALDSGMASIEADIFYVEIPFVDADGEPRAMRELYIAHDWEEIEGNVDGYNRTKGTLSELYLDPLWEIYQETGEIYPGETLLLHADMKTATETTWPVLENTLRNYPGLFTTYDVETQEVTPGPVTVYTNEEPGGDFLAGYGTIHSTADGRFGDIFDPAVWDSEAYTERSWRMPIISSNFQSYIDIERMFEFQVPEDEIVSEYSEEYPDLTAENLASELDSDGWALANQLLEDGSITVSDYLVEQLEEASRLGTENSHLMRFWASPDAQWFWDIAGPLENVVILTDHPREVSSYLQGAQGGGAGN